MNQSKKIEQDQRFDNILRMMCATQFWSYLYSEEKKVISEAEGFLWNYNEVEPKKSVLAIPYSKLGTNYSFIVRKYHEGSWSWFKVPINISQFEDEELLNIIVRTENQEGYQDGNSVKQDFLTNSQKGFSGYIVDIQEIVHSLRSEGMTEDEV